MQPQLGDSLQSMAIWVGSKIKALMKLKDWNYKTIYESDMANKNYEKVDKLFKPLYNKYLEKLQTREYKTTEGKDVSERNLYEFINKMEEYSDFNLKRAVIDYIAGQTDKFFLNECKKYLGLENVEKLYKKPLKSKFIINENFESFESICKMLDEAMQ